MVAGALGVAAMAFGVAGASAASPTGGSALVGRGAPPLLAPVPYMGWNTYYGVGGCSTSRLRNLDHDAAHPAVAGPGHWNDPDYLGPELGMTGAEAQAQLSMWAIVAAPLILGSDPRMLAPSTISMLENREVLAVDQDRLGVQGRMIAEQGSAQVWTKPLVGGQVAVALLNRGAQPLSIDTTASRVGLPAARSYRVRDLWAHETTTSPGDIGALVAPDSLVLYRVAPAS